MPARFARVLAPLLVITALGCNEKAINRNPDAAAAPGGLTIEQAAKPLARFGDRVITLGDFAQALADMPEYERMKYQGIERRKDLLRAMIDMQLLADEAKRLGLDKDPIVLEETRQIFVAWMRGRLLSELPAPSAIPEADVRAYYDSHIDLYREPERRRVAHILVKDEATAKKVYDEAKTATPTAWGGIVKKFSDDKPAGTEAAEMTGDVGFVTAPSDTHAPTSAKVTAELRTAAFALKKVGDVSPPFKDGLGWRVIRLLVLQDANQQSFNDVERTIRIRLLQEMRANKEKALVDEMRKKLKVEIDETILSAIASSLAVEPAPTPAPAPPAPSVAPSASAPKK